MQGQVWALVTDALPGKHVSGHMLRGLDLPTLARQLWATSK